MLKSLGQFRFLLARQPTYIIYWVTQNCNFTCEHCFNYIENQKRNTDLSLEEVQKFASHQGHIKYAALAGGEPMLRKDLDKIAEIFYKTNGVQIINVVSNGWFTDRILEFTRTVLSKCPNLHLNVSCSIDGTKDVHDKIRMKKGSFDQAVKTLKSLQEIMDHTEDGKRLSIAAAGTYSSGNAEVFLETGRYMLEEVGVPFFHNIIRGEDVQNNGLKKVDMDHYMKVAHQLHLLNQKTFSKNYPFRRTRLALFQTVQDIGYESVKNNKMLVSCKAGKMGYVLTANGEVMLCEVLNIRLGNIREYDCDPLKVLSQPKAVAEIDKIVQEKCHCSWECFQSLNTVYSPHMYPKVAWHMIKNTVSTEKPNPNVPPPDLTSATFRSNDLAEKVNFPEVPDKLRKRSPNFSDPQKEHPSN